MISYSTSIYYWCTVCCLLVGCCCHQAMICCDMASSCISHNISNLEAGATARPLVPVPVCVLIRLNHQQYQYCTVGDHLCDMGHVGRHLTV